MANLPKTILEENREYWTGRAAGYSAVNQVELSTVQRKKWKQCIQKELAKHFSDRTVSSLSVLEVGTGPGFFAILLTELGCAVTAIDLTPAMLFEAIKNAGSLVGTIRFLEMNAEALGFFDDSFDLVISRYLTWNLPHPETAYAEWVRVLKPGGLLLNFDANWYSYLFDESAKAAFQTDRANTAKTGIKDENIGENFDVMEEIARRVPLSRVRRPSWDWEVLSRLGCSVSTDEKIWETVWSEDEKINFASTPLFLIRAVK